ncbi:hypothetical protein DL98DRAFT_656340 [Cadophora sp. DSE1049]|nr:hypothetical protein DL98DRAFT_656340 [Cadophora sp. DSE1049]
MQPSIVHLLFISTIFLGVVILQLRNPVSGVNATSVISPNADSPRLDPESQKLSWSYRSVLTLEPVYRRAVGSELDALSSASNGFQLLSPAFSLSPPAITTSSVLGSGQPSSSSSPVQSISSSPPTVPSTSPPTPAIANSPSPASSNFAPIDPVAPGNIHSISSDVTPVPQTSETPITSIITKDGTVYSYSATFVSSQTSVTTVTTSEETDAAGAVFGVITFPGKGGRGWKFPCLISCGGGFSLPGPPPGFGALGGIGGGGGGSSGGSLGAGGGSNGGGGSNSNDSVNENNRNDNENENEDEQKSQRQSESAKSGTSSASSSTSTSSSLQCSTQTASSCVQTCPPASQGSISNCFETCITSTGCSISDAATTTTQSCSSLPCQTLVVTTIGGSMTSETYCPDCGATSTEMVTDPAESGWATTGSSYSYVTILTITIVTDDGFVHPDFMVDTALEYSQMSSMDREISARHTKQPSTLVTSVVSASASSSAQAILSTSQLPVPSTPVSTTVPPPTSTIISSPISTAKPSSGTAQSQGQSSLPASSLQVSSPSSTKTPNLQPILQEPAPTPSPIAKPPVVEPLPITATRGECNTSRCAGVDRDLALKQVKKFCSKEVTINSKTAIVSSTASLTGVVTKPTSQVGQLNTADLYLAIELDGKDDRCTGAEYVNRPKTRKPPANGRDYVPDVIGPNELCMDMMTAALDHCDTGTTVAKQGGKQIANCISWSVLATNSFNKCVGV